MSRLLARGAPLGVAIERPPLAAQLVAPAALASAALLGEPVERSWGKPSSWSTPDRPSIDIGVRPMGLDTNLEGLNSLFYGVVVTCDAATHLGVGLYILHSVKIHHTEIA